MDNYTLMPLYGHKFKPVGLIFIIISFSLFFFTDKICQLALFHNFSKTDCITLLMCLIVIGLYFIAFSKEKYEDERTSLIRDKTFRVSFVTVVSALIAVTLTQMVFLSDFSGDKLITISKVHQLFMFLAILSLLTHLIIFYYRLFTNSDTSSYDFTVMENIRNNKLLYAFFAILYLAGIIALIVL